MTEVNLDPPGVILGALRQSKILLVCLSPAIPQADVEPLALGLVAWHQALKPAGETTVVFRDSAFADDVAKTNLTAILQQHGLETVRSL